MASREERRKRLKYGFTLVELSLSIAFIGILSLTVALIINDTIATYRRGLTLNQINTVGMDLVDDIKSAIQDSSSKSLISECESLYDDGEEKQRENCIENRGINLVSVTRNANVTIRGEETLENVPVYGAFCTGTYSYIWKSGYFFNNSVSDNEIISNVQYQYGKINNEDGIEQASVSEFRLLKVQDKSRGVCFEAERDADGNLSGVFKSTKEGPLTEEPIELLAMDNIENNLALYDLQSAAPIESNANNGLFYSVSFVLGTVQGGVNVMSNGNFCAVPEDYANEYFDYCAINKFNFAAQATGV